jgi:hypothetical protein
MPTANPNYPPRPGWFIRHPMGGMIVLLGAVIAIPFVTGIAPFMCQMAIVVFDTASKVRALRARNDYDAIARDCLQLVRSVHSSDSEDLDPNDPRLTSRLRSLRANHISISDADAHFEFQGGFDHYGVDFCYDRDDPLEWKLYFYTEHSRELLATIRG